jgi:DNA-binding PadR family transcriptional regulator
LGFLSYKPHSGYDLKAVFDASVQHFWPADQSQIYRTLSRMEKKSWVEGEVIKQEDRPDRKVYHITPAGRNELREWLSAPLPPTNVRNAELIQCSSLSNWRMKRSSRFWSSKRPTYVR